MFKSRDNNIPGTDLLKSRELKSTKAEKIAIKKVLKDTEIISNEKKSKQKPLIITDSLISLYSLDEIRAIAPIKIINTLEEGYGSINDPRMGSLLTPRILTIESICEYCQDIDCPGHYGIIEFPLPIHNPAFIREIISVLRCICNNCGKLLINERTIREQGLMIYRFEKRLSNLEKYIHPKAITKDGKKERSNVTIYCKNPDCDWSKDRRKNEKYTTKFIVETGTIRTHKHDVKITEKHKGDVKKVEDIEEILNKISEYDAMLLGFSESFIDSKIYELANIISSILDYLTKDFYQEYSDYYVNELFTKNADVSGGKFFELFTSLSKRNHNFIYDQINKIFKIHYYDRISNEDIDRFTKIIINSLSNINIDYEILRKVINNIIIARKDDDVISGIIGDYLDDFFNEEKVKIINEINKIFNKDKDEDIDNLTEIIVRSLSNINIEDEILRKDIKDIIITYKNDDIMKGLIEYINNIFTVEKEEIVNEIDHFISLYDSRYFKKYNKKGKKMKKDIYEAANNIIFKRKIYNRSRGLRINSHPKNMIMHNIIVPPVIARPPIYENGRFQHNSLTRMLMEINKKVALLANAKYNNKDATVERLALHKDINYMFFNIKRTKKYQSTKQKLRETRDISIWERIQGKKGIMRSMINGKTVESCGRTVAGPDPSLKFGQIRIPEAWAPILTKRITVTDFNINYLNYLLNNNFIVNVIDKDTGISGDYNKNIVLKIGDKVDRWLQNGDRVVVNRQPTLHSQSMMGFEVVLGKENTIGLHLSYTPPMNADFDGDELNCWDPQDFEVEAEVEIIMNVKNNIMSDEQNRPIMGCVMNSITAPYLLTKIDTIIDDDLFLELLSLITNKTSLNTLDTRLTKYKINKRSGAAIFSALLPEDFYYNQKDVIILQGILISGRVKKAHVGATHRSIIQELHKKYGSLRTSDFFTDATFVFNKWILEYGFSVGLLDMINLRVDPLTHKEYDENLRVLKKELTSIYFQIEALGGKSDIPIEEEFRNQQIRVISDKANSIGTKLARDVLTPDNSIGVMTEKGAGTKGGVANIGQMMGAVGQQFYRGERLQPKITNGRRLLPCYDVDDENPEAHGFIPDSFFTGLSPEGLFFLMQGGRENLLDTALKTKETGDLNHKMIKAFENIIIGYDGSVRNTVGTLFTPTYNSGYKIGEMIMIDTPGKQNFSSFIDIKSLANELNINKGYVPKNIADTLKLSTKPETRGRRIIKGRGIVKTEEPQLSARGRKLIKPKEGSFSGKEIQLREEYIGPINSFEKSRIIGTRAVQLSNNDPPKIDLPKMIFKTDDNMLLEFDEVDPIKIATLEFENGLIDFDIIRKYPDSSYIKIKCSDLSYTKVEKIP